MQGLSDCPAHQYYTWDKDRGATPQRIYPTLTPPAGLSVSAITTNGFTVSWQPVASAERYGIEMATDPAFETLVLKSDQVGLATNFIATGLPDGARVFFRVKACAKPIFFMSDPDVVMLRPVPPVILPPTVLAMNGFGLNWQSIAHAVGYHLDVSTNADFRDLVLQADLPNVSSFRLDNLPLVSTYYYRLRTRVPGFESADSATQRLEPSPTALPATAVGFNGLTAHWQPLGGAQAYRLDLAGDPEFRTFWLMDQAVGMGTSYTATNLPTGGFYYRVRAVAGAVTSANSQTIGTAQLVPNMVYVAPGTYTMGSPDWDYRRSTNEGPQTIVRLTRGFWINSYETTIQQCVAMGVNTGAYYHYQEELPELQACWGDAMTYAASINAREAAAGRLPAGYAYRLPTEAEWEYACRAGTTSPYSYGSDYNSDEMAMWSLQLPGQYPANAWGLYDMNGNAGEWCLDCWGYALPGGSLVDPRAAPSSVHVSRGGSAWAGPHQCRSASRSLSGQVSDCLGSGLRLVLAPE